MSDPIRPRVIGGADSVRVGATGQTGAYSTVEVGSVETLPPGSPAYVNNTGTNVAAVLNFGIPKGAPGQDGQDGQPGADGADGVTFTPSVDSAGNISWTNDGERQNPQTQNIKGPQGVQGIQGLQGPAGADGADGADGITPTIGENGNWYLGDTDTGKPSRGVQGEKGEKGAPGQDGQPGEDGADGADGKSAYQSAQDGGYTGTESQFNSDLAEIGNKSAVSVSAEGTATDEVHYITIDGVQKKLAGGGYEPPTGGIPETDLSSEVREKLNAKEIKWAEYNVTSAKQIYEWVDAGYDVKMLREITEADPRGFDRTHSYLLSCTEANHTTLDVYDVYFVLENLLNKAIKAECLQYSSSTWTWYWNEYSDAERTSNKVTSLSASSTDTEYPSAKTVYDAVKDKAEIPTITISQSQVIGQNPLEIQFTSEQDAVISAKPPAIIFNVSSLGIGKITMLYWSASSSSIVYEGQTLRWDDALDDADSHLLIPHYAAYYSAISQIATVEEAVSEVTENRVVNISQVDDDLVDLRYPTVGAIKRYTQPVTSAEKNTWNGKEDEGNKVTTLSASSTDTEYPSAKAVYDLVNSIAPVYTLNEAGGYTVTIGRAE